MPFSRELLFQELHTARFGCELQLLEETTSTLDTAWQWLHANGPEGGVVVAGRQTAGRGRAGRRWISPEGGLWMSVITRPALAAEHAGRLGTALALAATEAVRMVASCEAGVKWPNDVMLEGRKLAGVLGEAEVKGGRIAQAVLSVGLNANLRREDLPEEVREAAATLLEATGQVHALELLAARTLEALERLWQSVLTDGSRLASGWQERDTLLGRQVAVEAGRETIWGEDRGIDGEGALRLMVEGEERRVTVGEIVRIRTTS